MRYLLIDAGAYADADLAAQRNLAAALFRLENSRGPEPVREVLTALTDWLSDPEQAELRRSFVLWLRQAFLRTRLPTVQFPELGNMEEIRIMLTDRVLDRTQQWKQEGLQEGLHSERRMLRRLIRRRFGEGVEVQSTPLLERIVQPEVFEDLGEALFDCADDRAWLARLTAAVGGNG